MTSALVTAIAVAILPAMPQRAEAKTGVLRCQMADGTSAYTNQACSGLGAKSLPLPAETLDRIAREQRREALLTAVDPGLEGDAHSLERAIGVTNTTALVPTRRPLANGCATTPQQLALDLQGSVALGDVNRVAESFDWAGMDNAQAQKIMTRLAQIAQRPVRDSEYFDARGGLGMFADSAQGSDPDGSMGVMQVTFDADNGASIVDFQVRRDKGCYFLRY